MAGQSKHSRRIANRLLRLGVITAEQAADARIERAYVGHWQRSSGAWSWCLTDSSRRDLWIGSQWSATECLAADSWGLYSAPGGLSIIPNPEVATA